jgi:hypothetical protein
MGFLRFEALAIKIGTDREPSSLAKTMSTLIWILGSGILMSAIALIGSVTLFIQEATL